MKGWLRKMRRRDLRLSKPWSILLLVVGFLINPWLITAGESSYPIKDSKFPAAEAKLGWIDNERVIFHGYEPGKFGTKSPRDGHVYDITGLFVWNTTTNVVSKHASIEGLTSLCVHAGEVTFAKEGMLVSGKLGEEQQTPFPKKHWFNEISCRYYTERPYWSEEGRRGRGFPLLEEHGYVDFGEQSMDPAKARPLVLYPPGTKDGVVLPLNSYQVEVPPVYVEFTDAYLLRARQFTSDAVAAWLLKPNGTVSKIFEPQGQAWERIGWGGMHLTKRGLFLVGGRAGYDTMGTAGGYLLADKHPQRLIVGLVWNESVSPDGCKVAFVHVSHSQAGADSFRALQAGKSGSRTIKMVDLCKGE
jgi:hypothetical protein